MHKIVLYQAGSGGYTLYRIPAVIATRQGAVLTFCEARRSARGDWGATDILLRRSADGGRTWEAPRKVGHTGAGIAKNAVALQHGLAGADERTCGNPVPIAGSEAGVVHLVHCVENERCFHLRSNDDGRTWSEPAEITAALEAFRPEYDWRVFATGPGHGIQLRSGRLLVPVWLSTGTGGHGHRPSCIATIYSDDGGRTWQRGDLVVNHSEQVVNPSESVAIELSDGRVMLSMRTESPRHRRLISYSPDGATHWSPPAFDDALFEPVCCASLVRLGEEGPILFANPDSQASPLGPNNGGVWPRENLTVRLSWDEGQTWPRARVLEPGIAGYSDLAVAADGTVYCFYESGGVGGNMTYPACLTMARFNTEWLLGDQG